MKLVPTVDKEIHREHTGRAVPVTAEYHAIHKLASLSERRLWLSCLARRIARDLRVLPRVRFDGQTFYRGRPATQVGGDAWEEMGPPDEKKVCVPVGRYNREGIAVLYLASTEQGIRNELAKTSCLCIQEYLVGDLRIVDLSNSEISDRLHTAFDVAESACVDGRVGPKDFTFSNYMADRIRDLGCDGFLVPGVRGESTHHYRNLVVFDPEPKWRQWSLGEVGFKRDSTA
jgi:hypothetical protein